MHGLYVTWLARHFKSQSELQHILCLISCYAWVIKLDVAWQKFPLKTSKYYGIFLIKNLENSRLSYFL